MKRTRCLNVSSNIPENGNAHSRVQHGYFQVGLVDRVGRRVGLVDRGRFSLFRKELGSPKKDEHDPNHGFSGVRAYKDVGSTSCY